jgi:hypothetical protein
MIMDPLTLRAIWLAIVVVLGVLAGFGAGMVAHAVGSGAQGALKAAGSTFLGVSTLGVALVMAVTSG